MNQIKTTLLVVLFACAGAPALFSQWVTVSPGTTGKYESIFFFDASNGIVSSTSNVIKTSNGGDTWTPYTVFGIRDIDFVGASNGYAAGYVSQSLKKTTNGGVNWTPLTPVNSNSLWGISMVDANTVYACGTGNVVWKSLNGGLTFSPVNVPVVSDLAVDLQFFSSTTGCVLSQVGGVWRTTNGGANWINTYNTTGVLFTSIFFLDANTGFAAGSAGRIIKTTNGGVSWTALNTGSTANLEYVDFFDANNGIAVGYAGVILRTTDGGATWQQENSGTTEHLLCCILLSPTSAIVGGDNGLVMKNANLQTVSAFEPETEWNLSAFPNPGNGKYTVDLGETCDEVLVMLTDVHGKTVFSGIFQRIETVPLDIEGSAGVYFLTLISDNRRAVVKLLKE